MAALNSQPSRSSGHRGSFCNIRVGSLNCRGICDRPKRRELFTFFRESKLTFIFLQETKFCPFKHEEYVKDWHNPYIFLNSIRGGKCGVGILINTHSVKVLNKMADCEGRVIVLDVDIFGSRFHLVNGYFPNEPFLREDFILSLYPYLSSSYPVIWCGDHNIVCDPVIDRLPSTNINDYCHNHLSELIEYFNFTDVCRHLYPNEKVYTFRGPTSRSRIDKVLISPLLHALSYDQVDMLVTDHDLVIARIQYRSVLAWGKRRWRNNCSLYNEEGFLYDFKQFWIKESQGFCRIRNPNKWWVNTKYQFKLDSIKRGIAFSAIKKRKSQLVENGLVDITKEIISDPGNKSLYKKYDAIKKDLANQQINLVKDKIFREKASSIIHGVRPTKQFFSKYKKEVVMNPITCLKNADGVPQYNIDQILNVVESHFKKLFSPAPINENVCRLFLEEVVPVSKVNSCDITRPLSMCELEEVLASVPNNSPGPDGLSYNFYEKISSEDFFKGNLLVVLNNLLYTAKTTGKLPAKIVEGLITLVPKRPPFDLIENYRPISLLNTDLKILTKVISNRLKPLLCDILHPSQYAQPGKDINMLNSYVRDLLYDMDNSDDDSFFVSVDFKGAFDRVSHSFLFKVLQKIGFSVTFVNFIKALYHSAASIIFVNGHQTKKIKIKSGIRQGCTLSRDMFTIALNPLLCFLDKCERIRKYRCASNVESLTCCFSDDANFFTGSLSSLLTCLFYIAKYKDASGLEINYGKTKGVFFDKKHLFCKEHLPNISWVSRLEVLGVHYGQPEFINAQWVEKLAVMKSEIQFFNSIGRNTLQDKFFLSKSKLLPLFSYVSNVHPIPNAIARKIDKLLLKFIVPHEKTFMDLFDFAAPKNLGGYGIDHITLHCSLFLLRPVISYIKSKALGEVIPENLHFVEYFLGLQICSLYNFTMSLNLPHALMPNAWYNLCYEMLVGYNISIEECIKGRPFSRIYARIVNEYGVRRRRGNARIYRLHYKCFPEYIKTFNYKLYFNLLPLNLRFNEYRLDNESRCYFCKWGPENEWHVFGKCNCLRPLWDALDEVVKIALDIPYSFVKNRTVTADFDLVNTLCPGQYECTIVYLNSIVNHKIYKMRNEIKYEGAVFNVNNLFRMIVRSITSRRSIESRLTELVKVPMIDELYRALVFIKDLLEVVEFDR